MTYTKTELSEIISTRTCHDLIGNIGTLSNVLEFIKDDGSIDAETKELLETASELLNARQKFFRMAFGIETRAQNTEELQELCVRYINTVGTRGHKIDLCFQGVSPQLSKLVCLCVMTASDIFIKGGNITVSISKENISVRADTDFKFRDSEIAAYHKILQGQKPEDNISQYAQLIYLRELLGENVPMHIDADESRFALIIG